MDDDQIRLIAREAGREAGKEICRSLGIDLDDPKSMRTYHANQAFLYRFRRGTEDTVKTARRSAIGICIMGICTIIWWGLTKGGPPPVP